MSTGNSYVKLFFRILPCEKVSWDYVKIKDKKTIYTRKLQDLHLKNSKTKVRSQSGFWEFISDGVFYNVDQKNVYKSVVEDLLERVIEGCNGVIVAYGQTGTGKSFTVNGLELHEQDYGIIPQIVKGLFELKGNLPNKIKMCIQLSFVEFTPTKAVDLFAEPTRLLGSPRNREATKMKVTSQSQALELLYLGEGKKAVIEAGKYFSHVNTSVLTIHVTTKNVEFSDLHKISSRIHIIDMAGSDVPGNKSCNFKSLRHITRANLTKMTIEHFFLSMRHKTLVCDKLKQRMSPLIYYLHEDLSRQSDIRFIGHIKISKEDLPLTLSTLRFGQFVRGIRTVMTMPLRDDQDVQLEQLQLELERIKKEKMEDSVLLNQNLSMSLNNDRIEHIKRLVQDYIRGKISEIAILNVAEASTVFKVFKDMCSKVESEKKSAETTSVRSQSSFTQLVKSSKSMVYAAESQKKLAGRKTGKKALVQKTLIAVDKGISVQSFIQNLDSQSLYKTSKARTPKRTSPTQLNKLASGKKFPSSEISVEKVTSFTINFLPEKIPDNDEAWESYCEQLSYKSLYDDYKMNENHFRSTYLDYLEQIKKLQEVRDIVDERTSELQEARMFKKFTVIAQERQGMPQTMTQEILNGAEEICETELNELLDNMHRQEEDVLKLQSLLKLFLIRRKTIRTNLNHDFKKYCLEKFNIPMVFNENQYDTESFVPIKLTRSGSVPSMSTIGTLSNKQEYALKIKKGPSVGKLRKRDAVKQSKITWV